MDRGIVYPGQVPLETDVLFLYRSVMAAFAKLSAVTIGTGGILNNCPCVPGAGLSVSMGPGEVYQSANIDDTIFGSMPLDIAHQIVKQGILLDATTLSVPAPGTVGQSIAYLIQCKFLEVDGSLVSLPYYNSATPTVPFSGPNGAGTSQPTRRAGTLVVNLKIGTPATTGSQVTPSVDAGYIGAWIVTIANGATIVTTANILSFGTSNFVGADLLTQVRTQRRAQRYFFGQF